MTKYTFKVLATVPGPSEFMLDGVDFGTYEREAIISDSFNSSTYITKIRETRCTQIYPDGEGSGLHTAASALALGQSTHKL
jgi:hypothetical protein